ncbi:GNAT family N-acyltransferase [Nitrosophilus kaiyonis]|uniref:GNAT family N-acyltransferase n=1 Tax=Nitrosophilus kaiyonis TaxID=2930200 RepID=UPI0024939C10|nr:GNAT family N-acyltransferase [Nitrosophilus kaiyonis]
MLIFKEIKIDDPLMEEVYKFRCEVLCEELQYFNKKKFPDKKEKDLYDNNADHFVALDEKNNLIAYLRIIYYSENGFPLENNMQIFKEYEKIPKKKIAELSRMFIKKEHRKIKKSLYILENFLKLFIYKKAKENDIEYFYATLQSNFLRLMKIRNVHFKIIGPLQEYGGKRYPTILSIKDLEKDRADLKKMYGDKK